MSLRPAELRSWCTGVIVICSLVIIYNALNTPLPPQGFPSYYRSNVGYLQTRPGLKQKPWPLTPALEFPPTISGSFPSTPRRCTLRLTHRNARFCVRDTHPRRIALTGVRLPLLFHIKDNSGIPSIRSPPLSSSRQHEFRRLLATFDATASRRGCNRASQEDQVEVKQQLRDHLARSQISWLRTLPLYVSLRHLLPQIPRLRET